GSSEQARDEATDRQTKVNDRAGKRRIDELNGRRGPIVPSGRCASRAFRHRFGLRDLDLHQPLRDAPPMPAPLRYVFLVLEEHPYGREMLRSLLAAGLIPLAVIEERSAVAI